MLARIRPAGLVCRLVRQEKHNTRLVNVRYRRGASSSSSSHRPDVVPFGSVVGLLLNDGDCCWTTTRQCFGGDTSQRDTSQRDTSQRRAGRGGGGQMPPRGHAPRWPPSGHTARVRPRPFAGPLAMPRMGRQERRVALSGVEGPPDGQLVLCVCLGIAPNAGLA